MHKKIVALAALVAVAGLAAAAGALTVKQRSDTASLYAERYTVGELFVVDDSTLAPIVSTIGNAGVAGAPVELASPLADARVGLVQDQWAYRVKLKESSAGAVSAGQYVIELQVNGVALATLYIEQTTADANAVEGVLASFGLGPEIQTSSLYYVVVKPHTPTGPTAAFTVRSATGDQWVGVGGAIEGATNPTLNVPVGATLRLTARNGDGGYHNIGLRDAQGGQVVAYTENIDATGEEQTLVWAGATAGTFTYRCAYHPDMKGQVAVA